MSTERSKKPDENQVKRLSKLAIFVLALIGATSANADYVLRNTNNNDVDKTPGDGNYQTIGQSITLYGADNNRNDSQDVDVYTYLLDTATFARTITFDWLYTTQDTGGSIFDKAGYFVAQDSGGSIFGPDGYIAKDYLTQLSTDINCEESSDAPCSTAETNPISFSGQKVVELKEGDRFGWYINATDAQTGLASLTVTVVPEPESYAMLMAGLGLMGFVARRRQKK